MPQLLMLLARKVLNRRIPKAVLAKDMSRPLLNDSYLAGTLIVSSPTQ